MRYFWLTCKHKWFVFLAGLRTKAPLWRLIIHDWSKFTPSELPAYERQFFGKADRPLEFSKAWLHHQNLNPHHWEYWIPRTGHSRGGFQNGEPLPMPEWAVREMVADWLAAGRTYGGGWPIAPDWPWLTKNWSRMQLHPETVSIVVLAVHSLGYKI